MLNNVLSSLAERHSNLNFAAADEFYWSPQNKTVYFKEDELSQISGEWALIHEVSHGILGHKSYGSDFELLLYEVQAWEKAKDVAASLHLTIEASHIERCLDTYRDWLYARSTCTNCQVNSLQTSPRKYLCLNCGDMWHVSASRFCRPYRKRHR